VLPTSLPIPANNHKTITTRAHDANSAGQFPARPSSLARCWPVGRCTLDEGYQEPPKAASVLASTARQSSSRSVCSTSAIALIVTGTR
jgi:hypothetical protein